jgi:hypothetical protein
MACDDALRTYDMWVMLQYCMLSPASEMRNIPKEYDVVNEQSIALAERLVANISYVSQEAVLDFKYYRRAKLRSGHGAPI